MNKITYLLIVLIHITACTGNPNKTGTQENNVQYDAYHNSRYNYTVEYPDFLIPQGEADNGDGQKFLSEDQNIKLLVYGSRRFDFNGDGDYLPIDKAFEESLAVIEDVLNKKLEDNHYIIAYKVDDVLYSDWALLYDEIYYNIRFEYPEIEKEMMEGVVKHVIKSFKFENYDFNTAEQVGNVSASEGVDMFPAFLEGFLKDCYWGKNFNSLLRNNDKTLATYIDSKMDVRRYHAPGTVTKLATRVENFGFADYDDYDLKPLHDGEVILEYINDGGNPSDLVYTNSSIVYYVEMQKVPDLLINMETFETEPVNIAYPDAEIMAVYLPDRYLNPRGFYFINTPDGWKLAFVDDSFGGA